jgi:hypothetical protein
MNEDMKVSDSQEKNEGWDETCAEKPTGGDCQRGVGYLDVARQFSVKAPV